MKNNDKGIDLDYIRTMISYAEKTGQIIDKANKYGIPLRDEMVIDSLAMNLGQIGEQLDTKKISKNLQKKYAHLIEWSSIKKFRDKAYHHYSKLDGRFILRTTIDIIPELLVSLRIIERDLEKELE